MSKRLALGLLLSCLFVPAPVALAEAPKFLEREVTSMGIEIGTPPGWQVKRGFRKAMIYDPLMMKDLSEERRREVFTVGNLLRKKKREPVKPPTAGKPAEHKKLDVLERMMHGLEDLKLEDPEAKLYKAVFRIETVALAGQDPDVSIHELASPYVAAARAVLPEFKILDDRDLILADLVAVRYITSHKRKAWPSDEKPSTFKEMHYFVSDGTNLFLITCQTLEPGDFDRYRPTFEKIAKTFDFMSLF